MRLSLSIVFTLILQFGFAQRHHFVSYSVKEGLAQSQVRDIVQAKDGYLWIATIGGVSRFDGKIFKNYSKANGLLNNVITSIYETSNDEILIACQGGIVRITNGIVEQFPFPDSLEQVIVFDILERDEMVYLATNGSGLLQWDEGIINRFTFENKNQNFIRSLCTYQNQLVLGSKSGLYSFSDGKIESILSPLSINKLIEHENDLWITTTSKGVYKISRGDTVHLTIEDGLNSLYQKDVCIDRDGNAWFISKNGFAKFDQKTGKIEAIEPTINHHADNLKVIYTDRDKNIWVGTSGSGLLKFTGEFTTTYTLRDGIASDQIMCIREAEDGKTWFATYGGGVMHLENGTFNRFNFDSGLLNNTVWSIETFGDTVWIGTSEGINIFSNGELSAFKYNDQLPFARVSSIFRDSQSNVWIGTRDGLIRYRNGSINTPQSSSLKELVEVKAFCEHNGHVWISSRHGVHSFDLETNELRDFSDGSIMEGEYISSLAIDLNDNLWMGSDNGVYVHNSESSEIKHLNISEKPSANIVNFLTHDSLNSLWIGTDNGLFSLNTKVFVDRDSIRIRSYNEHDGIISQECNQNAAYCDRSGMLWFGLNSALVSINPYEILKPQQDQYGVVLGELQVNFSRLNLDSLYHISIPSFIHTQNRFAFKYSAIQFSNPEKVFYSYRLQGSEDRWSPEVRENAVTYANLSPGEYEFETRVKLENTEWGKELTLFKFKITPPFYYRWWFILLVTILVTSMIYAGFYLLNRAKARRRSFEDIKNKAKMLGLEQQTLNAHMNRHFIFNALNSIQYYINTQEKKLANMYLTKFASLVRKNLDSAQSDYISLYDEIERLKLYMNLEQMRFKDRFDFVFTIEPSLNTENILVPSMILQPFVENSIMHGILPSESFGHIIIEIGKLKDDSIQFDIKDNGIGIETSVKQKNGTSYHVSNGMKITRQRMEVLSTMTGNHYSVSGPLELRNSEGNVLGTLVKITLPLKERLN